MNITVNGEEQSLTESSVTLLKLIDHLDLSGQPVVVELNGQALLSREFANSLISEGDRIEIIRIVAGG